FNNAVIAPGLVPTLGSAAFFNQQSLPTRPFQDNASFFAPSTLDLWGVSATAEWNITDAMSAKSITAYRSFNSVNGEDADHSPVLIAQTLDHYNSSQFSQELQLQDRMFDDRVKWILGGYFFDEKALDLDDVAISIGHFVSGGRVHNN